MVPRVHRPVLSFFTLCTVLLVAAVIAAPASAQDPFSWSQTAGPEGGDIWCISQAPNGDLYAGTWWGGGIFRSRDDGASWTEVGLELETIHHIVITNTGWVLAGCSSSGAVYRSTDDGDSWQLLQYSLVSNVGALAYDPVLDLLYAADSSELRRSSNGGDNWELLNGAMPSAPTSLVVIPNGGPLVLGTEQSKAHRSLDGGVSWSPFDTGISATNVTKLMATSGGVVYAASWGGGVYRAAADGTDWTPLTVDGNFAFCVSLARDAVGRLWVGSVDAGVFMSENDGTSWSPVNAGIETFEVRALHVLGTDALFAGTHGGLYHTVDAGASWQTANRGLVNSTVMDFARAGNGTLYAATWGSGVARSLDGGVTWITGNVGFRDHELRQIAIHPDGELFTGGWRSELYRSADGGLSWERADTGLGVSRVGSILIRPSGEIFVGGFYGGGVWRSTTKGDSWNSSGEGLLDPDVWDLFVEADGDLLAATYGGGVHRSTNGGDTWSPINDGLTELRSNSIVSLNNGILITGTSGGGVFRSIDDGLSWQHVDAIGIDWIDEVALNRIGHVFVSDISGHIHRSVDGGASWQLISSALPSNLGVKAIGFTSDDRMLLGTNGRGVYVSMQSTPVAVSGLRASREGETSVVVQWSTALPSATARFDVYRSLDEAASPVERVRVNEHPLSGEDRFLARDAGAPREECYYWLRVQDLDGPEQWLGPARVAASVLGLRLTGIRPNPLASSSTISFELPTRERYALDVYDLRGRHVRRLASGSGISGSRQITWDGRDGAGIRVSAGSYVIRLESRGRVDRAKLLVLGSKR